MTFADILRQAQALSASERKELARLLIDTLSVNEPVSRPKTGAEIVAALTAQPPVEFVDEQITDPVEWVKVQRAKTSTCA